MKLIESKAEYILQEPGLEGIYKQIELAGRTAYKSEDKITPDSAEGFVDRMIKSNHGAALEHGTVYFIAPTYVTKFYKLPYTKIREVMGTQYITTNCRVLKEWEFNGFKYTSEPTRYHEKRYTMKFTCSRAIAQELTRHRKFSFLMESQRYINYSKEKHGGEITLIMPDRSAWYGDDESKGEAYWSMLRLIDDIESVYMEAIKCGVQPQVARAVLPNATKTELVMTGFSSDWRYLFDLRLFEKTGKVDPDMMNLMQKAQKAMEDAGIWEDIMSKPSKFE